jgi:hypothetical protein
VLLKNPSKHFSKNQAKRRTIALVSVLFLSKIHALRSIPAFIAPGFKPGGYVQIQACA